MSKTTPPRKARAIKSAYSSSAAAGFNMSASKCTELETLNALQNYNIYGWNQSADQSYGGQGANGVTANYVDAKDQKINESDAKNASGVAVNLKEQSGIIAFTLANGLPSTARNYFFATASTPSTNDAGVTGSGVVSFIFDKSGPQAGYIPEVVHGDVSGSPREYTFLLPSTVTGSGGANMPPRS